MSDTFEDYSQYFNSDDCTCYHQDWEHGWDGCDMPRCKCEASWEE